ncbi:MAG: fumarate reductase subunit C [Fidelibacterota bacterium]
MTPYHRQFPNTWWIRRRPYFLFMAREFTSLFVAGYCVFLLIMIARFARGSTAYPDVAALMKSPVSIIFHALALPPVLYHTVTWFNLTPKILVLRIGEERVPPALIAGAIYAGWIVLSLAVGWMVLGG